MVSRLWNMRKEHPRFVALSIVTVAVLAIWPLVDFYLGNLIGRSSRHYVEYRFADWSAYSGALDSWTSIGEVYDFEDGIHGEYLYPPITLLVFYPFATLGFRAGAVFMGLLTLVILWIGLIAVARVLGYEMGLLEKLVTLPALLGFYPALRDFKWAQTATMLTAFLTLAFYTHELGEREGELSSWARYASGALTTLGSGFKLFFATSGAHLLRDRKRFVGAMVTAGTLLVASLAIFGLETHWNYLEILLWGKGWGDPTGIGAWGFMVTSIYSPLHIFGEARVVVKALIVIGVIALVFATRNADGETPRHATFALGVAIIPLAAPKMASQDLVVLLLPAMILTAIELRQADGYPWIPVLAILLLHFHRYGIGLLTNHHSALPFGDFLHSQVALIQPGMWGTFLLVGLAAYRLAEYATLPSALARPS